MKILTIGDVALSGIDALVMAPASHELTLSGESSIGITQEILADWNKVLAVWGVANVAWLLKEVGPGIWRFSARNTRGAYNMIKESAQSTAIFYKQGNDLISSMKATWRLTRSLGNADVSAYIKAQILALELTHKTTLVSQTSDVIFKVENNGSRAFVRYLDNELPLGNLVPEGELSFRLIPDNWAPANVENNSSFVEIGTTNNILYQNAAGEAKVGDLVIYKELYGGYSVKIVNSINDTWVTNNPGLTNLFTHFNETRAWGTHWDEMASFFDGLNSSQRDEIYSILSNSAFDGTTGDNLIAALRADMFTNNLPNGLTNSSFRAFLKADLKRVRAFGDLGSLLPQAYTAERANTQLLLIFANDGVSDVVNSFDAASKLQFFDNLLINPNKLNIATSEIVQAVSKEQYLYYILNIGTDLEEYLKPFRLYGYKSNNRSWNWYLNNLNTRDHLRVGLGNYNGMTWEEVIDQVLQSGVYSNMTKSDAYMAFSYTTNYYYGTVNSWILKNTNPSLRIPIVDKTVESLSKLPQFPSGETFWRGISIQNEAELQAFLAKYAQGGEVTESIFQSVAPNKADSFIGLSGVNIEIEILGKVGTNSQCRNIHDFAMGKYWNQPNNRTLSEGVFLPGVTFNVISATPPDANGIYRFIIQEL